VLGRQSRLGITPRHVVSHGILTRERSLGLRSFLSGMWLLQYTLKEVSIPPGELMRGQPSPRGREASSPHP
jgi:hypothetical protein